MMELKINIFYWNYVIEQNINTEIYNVQKKGFLGILKHIKYPFIYNQIKTSSS